MNVVLVIITDGGQVIVAVDIEAVEINYFLLYFIDPAKTLRRRPWPTPSTEAPRGGVQNHAAWGKNSSIMVGMFVCLCLASQKPSEDEFFVPAGTDLMC